MAFADEIIFRNGKYYKYDATAAAYLHALDLSPVHHFRLQEQSGTKLNDAGSNPVGGDFINSPTLGSTGKILKAVNFDPSPAPIEYAALDNISDDWSNGLTIMMWVYINAHTITHARAFDFWEPPNNFLLLMFENFSGKPSFWGYNDGVSWGATLDTPLWFSTGIWYHICLLSDGVNLPRIFLNGKNASLLVGSAVTGIMKSITYTDCRLAHEHNGNWPLDGKLEDFEMYNQVVPDQLVRAKYLQGLGTHSHTYIESFPTLRRPISHFKMQEQNTSHADVHDSGDVPYIGTLTGVVADVIGKSETMIAGKKSFLLAGSEYFTCGDIDLDNNSFTLIATLKRTVIGEQHTFFSQGSAGTRQAIQFGFRNTNKIQMAFYGDSFDSNIIVDDTIDWHQIAFVFEAGSPYTRSIYLDGEFGESLSAGGNYIGTGTFYVGRASWYAGDYPKAYIQNFIIYNYALQSWEIKNLWNGGEGTLV